MLALIEVNGSGGCVGRGGGDDCAVLILLCSIRELHLQMDCCIFIVCDVVVLTFSVSIPSTSAADPTPFYNQPTLPHRLFLVLDPFFFLFF